MTTRKRNAGKSADPGSEKTVSCDAIFPKSERGRAQHVQKMTEEAGERAILLWARVEKACRVILPIIDREGGALPEIFENMLETLVEIGALTIDTPERQGLDLLRAQSSIARKPRPKWWNVHALEFSRQICEQRPIKREDLIKGTQEFLSKMAADVKNESYKKHVPSQKTLDKFFAQHESQGSILRKRPKGQKSPTTPQ